VTPAWLEVREGEGPLIVALPHTGTEIPADIEGRLVSPWLARKDADWWVEKLYGFAGELGATMVRTAVSRTVIDVNRDPSGASLYPGQATTELCPTTTFDGEALYLEGAAPGPAQIARRRAVFFEPYHQALAAQIARLKALGGAVVLYDAHSIRSRIPRLFAGELPHLNIGSNDGRACHPDLTRAVERLCDASAFSRVTNGRFKGGWTTRRYGEPATGLHAIQMELACRAYMDEPAAPDEGSWPTPYDPKRAAVLRTLLADILQACLEFARR
jgi:formiminoglutamase